MTYANQDYTWEQGEDLTLSIKYTINDVPIDSTWKARMDIVPKTNPQTPVASLFSFNSDDLDPTELDSGGNPLDQTGTQDNEIVIDDTGNVTITIPRSLTLPGGVIGNKLAEGNTQYAYDLFVRDGSDKNQTKIMAGSITVNASITRWA